jgi:hypothetical protein
MANFLLPKRGKWVNRTVPTKSTTAVVEGAAIYNDGTNCVVATTGTRYVMGISREASASGTADRDMVIAVPTSPNCTFLAVATGTLTKAMEGTSMDFADAVSIAQATATHSPVTLVRFINANLGEFKFNYITGIA